MSSDPKFVRSALTEYLKNLDLTSTAMFFNALDSEISRYSRQGASDKDWEHAQLMSVAEEAGEFVGAYRRYQGFARRAGTREEMLEELSDVIISSFAMFHRLGEPADEHIKAKLSKVISRGYINKDSNTPELTYP